MTAPDDRSLPTSGSVPEPSRSEIVGALLTGFVSFMIIVGPAVLDPRNIAWMQLRDPAQYYLGWSFFRSAPWGWPPATNPGFGLEIASTIFFADVVPLMALILKATIAPPQGPWQYHGIWLLLCFMLQAFFALRIAALFMHDPVARLVVAALACFSPVLLWRLSGPHAPTGHLALLGQWLLLWAGWLCLRPPGRRQAVMWVALTALAAMVHSYLLAMALVFWLADLARRRWLSWRAVSLLAEALLVVGLVALALWLAGFQTFFSGGLAVGGFGVLRANLLALLDPAAVWSFVVPGKPRGAGDYEGFGYIGTGGVALLVAALWVVRREPCPAIPVSYWPFLAAILTLALFSLSNSIAVGNRVIVTIPMPEILERVAALFRSSGRMIWPLHYLIIFCAAVILFRRIGRVRGRVALIAALLLQVGDGAAGWVPIAREARVQGTSWASPLQDSFWDQAAQHYARIRQLPTANLAPNWQALSYLAVTHGLGTDAVYLARVDTSDLTALRERGLSRLRTGEFEQDTLYVLNEGLACRAVAVIDQHRDLLMRLDGIDVLAPRWLEMHAAPIAGRIISYDTAEGGEDPICPGPTQTR